MENARVFGARGRVASQVGEAMRDNTTDRQKRIVQELTFDTKTAKRVRWSEWEFTIAAPHQIKVVNASYGSEQADHVYTVTVADHDEHDDLLVPLHCTCPADQYGDNDCKHKVAVAVCGGPVLFGAAMAYAPGRDDGEAPITPVMTDGGQRVAHDGCDRDVESERARERERYARAPAHDREARADALGLECPEGCDGPASDSLPCFRCFYVGLRDTETDE